MIRVQLGGCSLRVSPLWQESTYAGLLEGYPTAHMNVGIIAGVERTAARLFPHEPFALARPTITRYSEKGAFGSREELPHVICIGLARHVEGLHALTLVVAWFQENPAPPVHPAVAAELERLDFRARARRSEI